MNVHTMFYEAGEGVTLYCFMRESSVTKKFTASHLQSFLEAERYVRLYRWHVIMTLPCISRFFINFTRLQFWQGCFTLQRLLPRNYKLTRNGNFSVYNSLLLRDS